jgi:hypothetical protein
VSYPGHSRSGNSCSGRRLFSRRGARPFLDKLRVLPEFPTSAPGARRVISLRPFHGYQNSQRWRADRLCTGSLPHQPILPAEGVSRVFSALALIRFLSAVRVDRCRASVFLPVCVRFGMQPASLDQSMDENRSRHAKVTQRLQREVRRHIPARLERRFSRLEGRGVTAAKACVRGHGLRQSGSHCPPFVRRRSSLDYPGARGRVKAPLARLAADAALTRPASLPQDRQLLERRHQVPGDVSSGPRATGIPLRGERFAAPGVFQWVVKKAPKFRHNLGQ